MRNREVNVLVWVISIAAAASAAKEIEPWALESFPFEEEYRQRISGMMERFAEYPVMERAMAPSVCPDTGKEVLTWALKGETIRSPYTEREYIQGDTGYFGPKRKNESGEITAFGGDPLKHSLAYAIARFTLDKDDEMLREYLGFYGSLRQQYHFAAVNWGRFWPLFHEEMGDAWNQSFLDAVAAYKETTRPSDGYRKNTPIRHPKNLVGNLKEHLGGGGTENHRTMWRATALLYAQILPEGSLISGYDLNTAHSAVNDVLTRYVSGLYVVGSGEYSSSIYYPYSFRGFSNLFDFSPKAETRELAKTAIDFYVATYGLKVFNGMQTGAQRRGYPDSHSWNEMDRHLWAWFGAGTRPVKSDSLDTTIHQITTAYRPNKLISALTRKEVALPFEAWINHPVYDMSAPDHHLEYYYCDEEFSLGSVQLSHINNSGQQTTWVLALRGDSGDTVTVTGGQPRWIQRGGHSPYDQYVQHKNTLLYMMDQSAPGIYSNLPETLESYDQILGHLAYDRYNGRAGLLREIEPPQGDDEEEWRAFLKSGKHFAGTWLWLPKRDLDIERVDTEAVVFRSGKSRVFLYPFDGDPMVLEPSTSKWSFSGRKDPLRRLESDRLLIIPGAPSGFAMEVVSANASDPNEFSRSRLDTSEIGEGRTAFTLDDGRLLELFYQGTLLRPEAKLEGNSLIPDAWQGRGHIDSPYLKIKDGVMTVSDGTESYRVVVDDPENPIYSKID